MSEQEKKDREAFEKVWAYESQRSGSTVDAIYRTVNVYRKALLDKVQSLELERDEQSTLITEKSALIEYLNFDINRKDERIVELEEELKCVSVRDFCYDLQVWVGDFLLANNLRFEKCLYTFQDIRKAAYTHRVDYYKQTPTWGDESYYTKPKQKKD